MQFFDNLMIKFLKPNWAKDTELGLVDKILDQNPDLLCILQKDVYSDESYR